MRHLTTRLKRFAMRCLFQPLQRWQDSRLPEQDVVLETGGVRLKVFPPKTNRISQVLYRGGVWEPEVTGAFRALIQPGQAIFDIGGDAGYYTLLFAKATGPTGKVIVFEPIPKAQQRILENAQLNHFTNVELVPLALGSQPGSFVLEKPFDASRLNLAKTEASGQDIVVQVVRLDTLAQERALPRADLIKIDVEGAELEVLRGMEHYVATHHPAFVIELHPHLLPQFNASVADVTNWLTARGYTLTALDAGDISDTIATTLLARAQA